MKETGQHTCIHQWTNVPVSVVISTKCFYWFSFSGKYEKAHLAKLVVFFLIFIKRHLTGPIMQIGKTCSLLLIFKTSIKKKLFFMTRLGVELSENSKCGGQRYPSRRPSTDLLRLSQNQKERRQQKRRRKYVLGSAKSSLEKLGVTVCLWQEEKYISWLWKKK